MSYASDDRLAQIRAAETAAKQALALAPDSAEAHMTYGTVLYAMRAPKRALREFEFAVGLDGNLAAAHAYLGQMKFALGRAHDTHTHVAEAMRLSPRDPLLFHWHFFNGVAEVYLGRVADGIGEPAQIGRDQSELGTSPVRPGRRAGARRAARGGSRSPCGRPASGAQFHHRQVPRRDSERQPRVPRATRAFLSRAALGGGPGGPRRIGLGGDAGDPSTQPLTSAGLRRAGIEKTLPARRAHSLPHHPTERSVSKS
jgi:tetratricopeptide (TPR) repeat protein